MKMEQTECSETSAYKIQTAGNYPKESIQHTEHGESLKLRTPNSTQIFFSGWSALKLRVPHQSSLVPLLFMIYINNLPLTINSIPQPVLYADDTSVIISSRNFEDFYSLSNLVLSHMTRWCAADNLVVNLDKTNMMKFTTKNSSHSTLCVGYKEQLMQETVYTEFLCLQIDKHINWKNLIEQIIP